MFLRIDERYRCEGVAFNMTPVIDIVFQLIIFFLLAFQFSGTEGTQVDLPQGCSFAESFDDGQAWSAAITVRRTTEGQVSLAVGAEQIDSADRTELVRIAKDSLEAHLRSLPENQRVVVLRIDREITCADAQYALAAAAQSSAAGLRLATFAQTSEDKD